MAPSNVYFTDMHTSKNDSIPAKLKRVMAAAGFDDWDLEGKIVAVKTHFGEHDNASYLRPLYVRNVVEEIQRKGGLPFVTDTATMYPGMRRNAVEHLRCAALNGFTAETIGCPIIIADGLLGDASINIPLPENAVLDEAYIARDILEADYLVVLSHAKGCLATGLAATVKNLAMGCATRAGKYSMHNDGKVRVRTDACVGCAKCLKGCGQNAIDIVERKAIVNDNCVGCGHCIAYCSNNAIGAANPGCGDFLQKKLAEYAYAVVNNIPTFMITVATDITPACDCFTGNDVPVVPNIGIFAGRDPLAIDQAVADKINASPVIGDSVLGQEGLEGPNNIDNIPATSSYEVGLSYGEQLGLGTREYALVEVK